MILNCMKNCKKSKTQKNIFQYSTDKQIHIIFKFKGYLMKTLYQIIILKQSGICIKISQFFEIQKLKELKKYNI